ncbi:hypothetical protein [Pseudoruegeria sp. HB172150]|uniref:hypothetical protein n=1 Tax=Pseudoruegeria sp. HB172150 TaxID=2721164 RepID=UPI0015540B11|nr:hypothetical protein [Pseudoruegeria sp. HB172150]
MAETAGKPLDETELESLFSAARAEAPDPSGALFERILADADAQLAARAVPTAADTRPRGLFGGLFAGIGGWPAAVGLAAAAVTGLTIGVVTPDTVDSLSNGYLSADWTTAEDLMPSYAGLLGES